MLPPTNDELMQHIRRANYQSMVWKRSLERDPEIPNPDGYGWKLVNAVLSCVWMENKPAAEAILELIECTCYRSCEGNCQCEAHGLRCTNLCRCEGDCANSTEDVDESEHEISDENDDDTDGSESDSERNENDD